jgi:5-methylcytosine-specific restriction endonuclease McrA
LIGNKFAYINGSTDENSKLRNSIDMRLWREAVFARDNYTCQKSDKKGGVLRAHHIYNFAKYPELRFAINNGITLSEKEHNKFHKKYGRKNNTPEQLQEFLKK